MNAQRKLLNLPQDTTDKVVVHIPLESAYLLKASAEYIRTEENLGGGENGCFAAQFHNLLLGLTDYEAGSRRLLLQPVARNTAIFHQDGNRPDRISGKTIEVSIYREDYEWLERRAQKLSELTDFWVCYSGQGISNALDIHILSEVPLLVITYWIWGYIHGILCDSRNVTEIVPARGTRSPRGSVYFKLAELVIDLETQNYAMSCYGAQFWLGDPKLYLEKFSSRGQELFQELEFIELQYSDPCWDGPCHEYGDDLEIDDFEGPELG